MTCTWESRFGGETFPCTRHEDGDHVFADGHRMPIAVTSVTYPPHRPVPLEQCEDVAVVLARHGLAPNREG